MSQIQPPVCSTGRVQSMKSRFENLCINSLEPLDISTTTGQLITAKKPTNFPNGFQFRRASTSFDFMKSNINNKNNKKQAIIISPAKPTKTTKNEENSRLLVRPTTLNTGDLVKNYFENRRNVKITGNENGHTVVNALTSSLVLTTTTTTPLTTTKTPPPSTTTTKLFSLANHRQNKNIQSKEQICAIAPNTFTTSDASVAVTSITTAVAMSTTTTTTTSLTIKPTLSEIKENVEQLNDDLQIINNKTTSFISKPSRLVRHTSDPIKRGSIKRSPAFRVGDKPNLLKTASQNRSKLSTSTSSSPSSSPPPPPIPPLPINHHHPQHKHHQQEQQSISTDNIINNKPKSSLLATSVVPEEFAERVENLLKHSSMNQHGNFDKNNTDDDHLDEINKLYQPGITDTLKAALKQPLPTGPPPKKPPRAFLDSPSPKENISPLKLFENKLIKDMDAAEEKKHHHHHGTDDANQLVKQQSTNPPLKSKINFLEQNLRIKEKVTNPKTIQKSNKISSSGIFGCIPLCTSAPIYDTVQIYKDEHIYMEPYAHLKSLPLVAMVNTVVNNNSLNETTSESSRMDSLCSNCTCSDSGGNGGGGGAGGSVGGVSGIGHQSTNETNIGDLHYLCTSIDSSIKSETSETKTTTSSTTDDGNNINDLQPISLTNTYDEINILVNAAFNERLISNMTSNITNLNNNSTTTNSREVTNANSINNGTVVSATATAVVAGEFGHSSDRNNIVNDENTDGDGTLTKTTPKINPKLSRSLTEKRKTYVQRIAAKNSTANLVSSYGTLYRTFKSPVIKTFSQNISNNDRGDDNNDDYNDDVDENNVGNSFLLKNIDKPAEISESTTERIKKYKKLVETTNNKVIQREQQEQHENIIQKPQHEEIREMSIRKSKIKFENNEENENIDSTINKTSESNLFQLCLLIGYNSSTGTSYIKSKYPNDYEVPQNIEQLVFPSSRYVSQQFANNQDYSLILTNDNGHRIYGYCRRVLPETCDVCLPLAYCIISQHKAPGFYFKLLKEIESRHGQTDLQLEYLLKQLQKQLIPDPGKFLHLKLPHSLRPKTILMSNHKIIANKRLSLDANPIWLTESAAQAAFSDLDNSNGATVGNNIGCNVGGSDNKNSTSNQKSINKKSSSNNGLKSLVQEFEEKKQQMSSGIASTSASSSSSSPPTSSSTSTTLPSATPPFDLGLINRSLLNRAGNSTSTSSPKIDEILINRPNDLRLESTELNDLYRGLGAEQLINVFGSLLLERKVILLSKNISLLSSCVFGLQTILYPFQWQYSLVSVLPQNLLEICQAPFPILIGILDEIDVDIEDGIMIDLDTKRVQQFCGDEVTILPSSLRDSLLVSLEMVDILDQGKMLSSVLIAEAFLRFFVELFIGLKNQKEFEKETFIQSHPDQSVRLFLEWFVETSMFRHFMIEKYSIDIGSETNKDNTTLTKTSTSNTNTNNTTSQAQLNHNQKYALFDARLLEKSENKTKSNQNIEMIMKNCKIINKKAKTFKDRFKHFLHS